MMASAATARPTARRPLRALRRAVAAAPSAPAAVGRVRWRRRRPDAASGAAVRSRVSPLSLVRGRGERQVAPENSKIQGTMLFGSVPSPPRNPKS